MAKATHREVEIKLPISDLPALVKRLRRLGARSRGRVLEENTLYDTREAAFRTSGRLLRLRLEAPAPAGRRAFEACRGVLTSKAPISRPTGRTHSFRYKERLERELRVHAPAHWPEKLRALGLKPTFCYEKFRTTYRLRGSPLHLDLDETPVGVFLELEGRPEAIDRTARALGFAPRDYSRGTYWDVYVADCRRRGRTPKNMVFRR
ncbi:MAG TPA: class IV adenylate cyclase [Candidatus Sulfotelmatobacter sp.]|nr:class IV adenylate cyclase [Candidatus Sulfotelmatobacter sp.]